MFFSLSDRKRTRLSIRKGYFFLFVIFGAITLAFFGLTLSTMNKSYRSQVIHTKQMQASFQIAYSAYQRILAKIYLKPWEERFFKTAPWIEYGVSLFGGTYDSFVHNVPAKSDQADIFIRVKLEKVPRTYVWRVKHSPELLDSNYFRNIFYDEIDNTKFPEGSTAEYSEEISDLITQRKDNRPKADGLIAQIVDKTGVAEITDVLGAPTPDIPSVTDLPEAQPGVSPPALTNTPPVTNPTEDTLLTNPNPKTSGLTADKITEKIDSNGRVVIQNINFETERFDLKPSSYPALEEILKMLQARTDLRIAIEGHTDNSGDTGYNQSLSEKRAQAVFDWLVGRGISGSRLQAVGRGETQPIADNSTTQGKNRNRRVELVKLT